MSFDNLLSFLTKYIKDHTLNYISGVRLCRPHKSTTQGADRRFTLFGRLVIHAAQRVFAIVYYVYKVLLENTDPLFRPRSTDKLFYNFRARNPRKRQSLIVNKIDNGIDIPNLLEVGGKNSLSPLSQSIFTDASRHRRAISAKAYSRRCSMEYIDCIEFWRS